MAIRSVARSTRAPTPPGAARRYPQAHSRWPLIRDGLAVLSIVLGIFFGVVVFLPAEGRVAGPLHDAAGVLFGRGTFLLPIVLFASGTTALVRSLLPEAPVPFARLTGAALVGLALLPTIHLAGLDPKDSLARAQAGEGGGYLGHWLGIGLLEWLGGPLTGVLLGGALAIGVLLALDLTIGEVAFAVSAGGRWALRRIVRTTRAPRRPVAAPGAPAPVVRDVGAVRRPLWPWRSAFPSLQWRARASSPMPAPAERVGPRAATSSSTASAPVEAPPGALPPTEWERAPRIDAVRADAAVAPTPHETRPIDAASAVPWRPPTVNLFKPRVSAELHPTDLKARARIIEDTLGSFNIEARVVEMNQGPAVTQFGVEPAQGVAVSRILSRQNDLALRLGASPIRLEAPVPGKRMVGVEVPNTSIATVTLRDVVESAEWERARGKLRVVLGRDVSGRSVVGDLSKMPHLLIAGATGSGKSVCINTIAGSLLYQFTPDELQLVMIDPKRVELSAYADVPHLRLPVVTDMDKVVGALKWVVLEMERRYKLFAQLGVRNLEGYNKRAVEQRQALERPLPFLVVIIDELADMMMTAAEEVEKKLCRLAQLARATGIHLVVATQRPSVDVVTGLIKANFPTRIAFAVSSQTDSRVILDQAGAEKLLGRGDALFTPPDAMKPIRLQGAFVADDEIQGLVEHWKQQGGPRYTEDEVEQIASLGRGDDEDDDVYDRAVELAETVGRLSASLLQRRLGIGHQRAQRLVDRLVEEGVAEE